VVERRKDRNVLEEEMAVKLEMLSKQYHSFALRLPPELHF
jgi:hypothetical protein